MVRSSCALESIIIVVQLVPLHESWLREHDVEKKLEKRGENSQEILM